MDDPIVSILLVTWKRIDLLEDCLNAIAAAKPAVPFELVIVNNGGSRTADRVEAIASGARIIHARVNLGLPGGLRLARSVARGRYLATLQDDVVVQEGWLDRLVERMDADPWVGIVGSRIELPDGHQICGLYMLGDLSWLHPKADPEPAPVDLCTSASMLIRARAWDDAGGPSPELFPLGYVDFDLCIRVARCGWIVEVLSQSIVRHKWHQSTSRAARTYTGWRNARLVREWHSTWLSGRPSQATLDDMRRLLLARATAIRANPPPPGKDPKPLTSSDLARLEKIARRGALRMRYRKFLFSLGIR
ncbi:MAG: glycosyltransferase [Betaproteobacteria bacterium]|nr:MAG: glycosyltransferase [Betaproteobacteria bacterium]